MSRHGRGATSAVLVCACAALLFRATGCANREGRAITQVGTFRSLSAGAYDGVMTCGELKRHGDFGLGTFSRLDGEMIALDGEIYQARSDGNVSRPSDSATVPFAEMVRFRPRGRLEVGRGIGYRALEEQIDNAFPDQDRLCAIRVKGRFSTMVVRSVPAQEKPYPPLADVTNNQPVFSSENISGTLVGFRAPIYAKELIIPGYHFHFIADDRQHGGHVLEFTTDTAIAEIDPCDRVLLIMTKSP